MECPGDALLAALMNNLYVTVPVRNVIQYNAPRPSLQLSQTLVVCSDPLRCVSNTFPRGGHCMHNLGFRCRNRAFEWGVTQVFNERSVALRHSWLPAPKRHDLDQNVGHCLCKPGCKSRADTGARTRACSVAFFNRCVNVRSRRCKHFGPRCYLGHCSVVLARAPAINGEHNTACTKSKQHTSASYGNLQVCTFYAL